MRISEFQEISSLDKLEEVALEPEFAQTFASVVEIIKIVDQGPKLSCIPSCVMQCANLQYLEFSKCSIAIIPSDISCLQKLQVLKLSHNNLNAVPNELNYLTCLREIDMGYNQMTTLCDGLCALEHLQVLNAMENQLTALPEKFGQLHSLHRLGLKSNKLSKLPQAFTQLSNLVELYVTDNKLETLPEGFGNLKALVKLQASFNSLVSLPEDIATLPNLEMLRVAVCQLSSVPYSRQTSPTHWPRLAWSSLGSALMEPQQKNASMSLPYVDFDSLNIGLKLGDGASGQVFKAQVERMDLAVKVFRGDISPDGHTVDEIRVAKSLAHPHITRVLAVAEQPLALVMAEVQGAPLASKPTSEHLLRCKWAPGQTFDYDFVLCVAQGIASALAYMHSLSICHGDVYAHNILVDEKGHATLCDFGASFFYPPGHALWEASEVRAFGLFLKDLAERISHNTGTAEQKPAVKLDLLQLAQECSRPDASARPSFAAICKKVKP